MSGDPWKGVARSLSRKRVVRLVESLMMGVLITSV